MRELFWSGWRELVRWGSNSLRLGRLYRTRVIRIACPIMLAIPFIAVVATFSGLKKPFPAFHSGDEMFHYPIILQFADEFPHVDVSDYRSATAPLFHLTLMLGGKLVGFDIHRLRLINALLSYCAVLLLFRFLLNHIKYTPLEAFAYASVFALSPYFFGTSFRVLTDNLAILFMVLALSHYYKFRECLRIGPFIVASMFAGAAVLTRQSYVWLVVAGLIYALTHPDPDRKTKVIALLVFVIALVPLFVLILMWGGLTPPAFQEYQVSRTVFNFRAVVFGVAVIGLYSGFLHGSRLKAFVSTHRLLVGAAVLLTTLSLLVLPVAWRRGDDGYVWRVCSRLPTLGASSILMFVLVPAGVVPIIRHWQRCRSRSMPLIFLITFLVAAMSSGPVFQKYFDPVALLFVLLLGEREKHDWIGERIGVPLLIVGFLLYPIIRHHMFA